MLFALASHVFFLSAVDICEIGLVTSRPLQILFMCTVDKYPRLVVWEFMKLDIDLNISLNDQQSENYDCNGHNGILMTVCDQDIVSGLTLQRLPSLVYRRVNSWHVCRVIPS